MTLYLSPQVRGRLFLAAVPLACVVIGRAMADVEAILSDRVAELAALDATIQARRRTLYTLPPTPGEPPPPAAAPETVCMSPRCDCTAEAGWYCTEHAAEHAAEHG